MDYAKLSAINWTIPIFFATVWYCYQQECKIPWCISEKEKLLSIPISQANLSLAEGPWACLCETPNTLQQVALPHFREKPSLGKLWWELTASSMAFTCMDNDGLKELDYRYGGKGILTKEITCPRSHSLSATTPRKCPIPQLPRIYSMSLKESHQIKILSKQQLTTSMLANSLRESEGVLCSNTLFINCSNNQFQGDYCHYKLWSIF